MHPWRETNVHINWQVTPPLAVLTCTGDLDVDATELLATTIDAAIDRGCRLFCLELPEVEFLDCAGLGALMAARNRLHSLSGRLIVANLCPQPKRLLRLTGTYHLLVEVAQDRSVSWERVAPLGSSSSVRERG